MWKSVWTVATSLGGAHASRNHRLEEWAPSGYVATANTVFPIHATHVPVNFIRVISEFGNDTWQSLSLFSQYWHFMKFITLHIYRLPTLLSGTKEVFEALSMWCFSPSFPYTSGDAPVTQPETIRIHNKGPEYRIFSCIYDILNSFVADSWRKRLDARLPPLGPEFTSRSLHVGFVVDETGSG